MEFGFPRLRVGRRVSAGRPLVLVLSVSPVAVTMIDGSAAKRVPLTNF